MYEKKSFEYSNKSKHPSTEYEYKTLFWALRNIQNWGQGFTWTFNCLIKLWVCLFKKSTMEQLLEDSIQSSKAKQNKVIESMSDFRCTIIKNVVFTIFNVHHNLFANRVEFTDTPVHLE